ncbi:MAG: MFS transporter [Rubrivivax sp.]|nr:MFS transporter [Rubrivivax sp.]
MSAAPAPLAAFGLVWFAYFATIGAFNPYAPLWFQELGFSTLAIGAIASLQSLTRVVAPFAWGWLGDHGGQRERLVRLAALGTLVAAIGLLFLRDLKAVALCTVLLFLANGGVVPLCEAALARHLSTAQGMDSARYGRVRVWGSVGFIIAVLGYGALLQLFGIGGFPWLVLPVFALLWLATLKLPSTRDEVAETGESPALWAVLRRPEVAWFFASVFFTVLAHTGLYAFFSLYLDSLGYPKSAVGALWAVSVAAEIVFFWFQGRFIDRFSPYRWLLWAALLALLRFAAIAAFGDLPAVLVAAQLLHAVTFAAHHAACILLINRHFRGSLRGRGQALYSVLGYGVSGVIGGVTGGWLSGRLGFGAVFWAATVAAALGALCARRAQRHGA